MANITYHSPINKGAARIQLLINGAWVLNTEFTDDYAACSFADAQKAEAFAKAVISVPWKIQAWDGGDWNTVKRDARLAACNNCGADYNESAPEYAEQDRSRGNLCLKCQSNTELIVIYDPSEERSAESDEIFPIKDVIERINESWYWAYREFTNAEFQQYRDDIHSIESIPDNCPLSLEALQAATDKSMASLQAFWAKYRTILQRDDKFCAFPVTFALKLELIPQAGALRIMGLTQAGAWEEVEESKENDIFDDLKLADLLASNLNVDKYPQCKIEQFDGRDWIEVEEA